MLAELLSTKIGSAAFSNIQLKKSLDNEKPFAVEAQRSNKERQKTLNQTLLLLIISEACSTFVS